MKTRRHHNNKGLRQIKNGKTQKQVKEIADKLLPSRGTIKDGEYHPAADSALAYLKSLGMGKTLFHQEAFASCALSGNRLAEICSETLGRLLESKPVSDRYVLGLAWTIRNLEDHNEA